GYNTSVAVWVGFIGLAGVAAETGVVMLIYLDEAYEHRRAEGRLAGPADVAGHVQIARLAGGVLAAASDPRCDGRGTVFGGDG
ncbi:MAG TPA: hypothetical protein VFM58_08750, partial [Solirubrobacteraceae bacterium]|nr:hypothetical protein [Solirubrobacteraceae bacterium]